MPAELIVESKSLKLFLSFSATTLLHEDCTVGIARRLIDTISPAWLRIGGYWYPRGGIPIDVFYQTGEAPAVCIPTKAWRDTADVVEETSEESMRQMDRG